MLLFNLMKKMNMEKEKAYNRQKEGGEILQSLRSPTGRGRLFRMTVQ
jgi:hypothetical protein